MWRCAAPELGSVAVEPSGEAAAEGTAAGWVLRVLRRGSVRRFRFAAAGGIGWSGGRIVWLRRRRCLGVRCGVGRVRSGRDILVAARRQGSLCVAFALIADCERRRGRIRGRLAPCLDRHWRRPPQRQTASDLAADWAWLVVAAAGGSHSCRSCCRRRCCSCRHAAMFSLAERAPLARCRTLFTCAALSASLVAASSRSGGRLNLRLSLDRSLRRRRVQLRCPCRLLVAARCRSFAATDRCRPAPQKGYLLFARLVGCLAKWKRSHSCCVPISETLAVCASSLLPRCHLSDFGRSSGPMALLASSAFAVPGAPELSVLAPAAPIPGRGCRTYICSGRVARRSGGLCSGVATAALAALRRRSLRRNAALRLVGRRGGCVGCAGGGVEQGRERRTIGILRRRRR